MRTRLTDSYGIFRVSYLAEMLALQIHRVCCIIGVGVNNVINYYASIALCFLGCKEVIEPEPDPVETEPPFTGFDNLTKAEEPVIDFILPHLKESGVA